MQNTENKFNHDGLWYVAVEKPRNPQSALIDECDGCAFEFYDTDCGNTPNCYQEGRQDNRNVIFVRSDVDNLGDEE